MKSMCSIYPLIVSICFITACSSLPKTMVLGTTIGAGLGSAIGSQQENSSGGAAVGALLGAGVSYLIHKDREKKNSSVVIPDKVELDDNDAPFLKTPRVRKVWEGDRIEGKKFIKGHWIYEIEEQTTWMKQ